MAVVGSRPLVARRSFPSSCPQLLDGHLLPRLLDGHPLRRGSLGGLGGLLPPIDGHPLRKVRKGSRGGLDSPVLAYIDACALTPMKRHRR
jgi:hypothetical protein